MSRYVIGIDPVITGVSIAGFGEGNPIPSARLVHAPTIAGFDVLSQVQRTQATADRVMKSITKAGVPDLVVMAKPLAGNHRDTSAMRRGALVGEIEKRLVEMEVPIAELAPMTIASWLLDGRRPRSFDPLDEEIVRSWGVKAPEAKYRLTAIALAAAGCVALGIPTKRAVTNEALAALSTMTMPAGWDDLPTVEPEWRELHGIPRAGAA